DGRGAWGGGRGAWGGGRGARGGGRRGPGRRPPRHKGRRSEPEPQEPTDPIHPPTGGSATRPGAPPPDPPPRYAGPRHREFRAWTFRESPYKSRLRPAEDDRRSVRLELGRYDRPPGGSSNSARTPTETPPLRPVVARRPSARSRW